jgi:hypothetical protein
MVPSPALLDLLYHAAQSPLGLVLEVEDFAKATQALYAARRLQGDPLLSGLQFRRSPTDPDHEVWIVRLTPREPPVSSPESAVAEALSLSPAQPQGPSNA